MNSPAGNIILNFTDLFAVIKKSNEEFQRELLHSLVATINTKLRTRPPEDSKRLKDWKDIINYGMTSFGPNPLDETLARNITNNMKLMWGVDKDVVDELDKIITDTYHPKPGSDTKKLKAISDLFTRDNFQKQINDSAIENIYVTTPDGKMFKLVNTDVTMPGNISGEGIKYIGADGNQHPLNELKF